MTCQQAPACHPSAPMGLLLQVFVEEADLDELAKTRQESQAEMDKHLADSNAVLDTMRDEVSLSSALSIMIGLGEHSRMNVEGSQHPRIAQTGAPHRPLWPPTLFRVDQEVLLTLPPYFHPNLNSGLAA